MNAQVQLLLDDPQEARKTWSHDPARFDMFLAGALSVVDSDPNAGKEPVKAIMRHAPTNCQRIQGYGLWAQIHRATDETGVAERAIEDAFFLGEECESCIADLHRRRAVLRRSRRNFMTAIEDADEAIARYLKLGHSGHDIDKNGLASSYNTRGAIHLFAENPSSAIEDFHKALAALDPKISPALYCFVIANLASSLYQLGDTPSLLKAEKYLEQARQLFIGAHKGSQERAKLDWLTAQVRFRLRKEKPYRIMGMMERSLSDFLTLGFAEEAVAVGSDIMKMKTAKPWGRDSYRPVIRKTLKTLSEGLPQVRTELCEALEHVADTARAHHLGSHKILKAAIDSLREACGPKMISCLLTW